MLPESHSNEDDLPIDFLVIGHITHDHLPTGFRLGGTASYAAVTAKRLGRHSGILSCGTMSGLSDDSFPGALVHPLAGVEVCQIPSPVDTSFVNHYEGSVRHQTLRALAAPVMPEQLPAEWAHTPIVLLGPIAREVPSTWLSAFPTALVGVTPQGWLRQWDSSGKVRPANWENASEFLQRADVVILSREDVGGDQSTIDDMAAQARLMIVTDGWRGATLYSGGKPHQITPRRTQEVDPTGAGDVFAASFLIRLAECNDPIASARFASVVASLSVESVGIAGIPDRERVDRVMAAQSVDAHAQAICRGCG